MQFCHYLIAQLHLKINKSSQSILFQSKQLNKMGGCCTNPKPQKDVLSAIGNTEKQRQNPLCQICTLPIVQGSALSCGHYFHTQCVQAHATSKLDRRQFDIDCPSGCGRELSYDELKVLLTNKGLFESYERLMLESLIAQKDQYLFCPTANCVGIYQIAGEDILDFQCFFCKTQYCLICRKTYHGDKDCDFGDEELSKAAMTKAGMKPCPYCTTMIDKIDGCNAVVCTRCNNQFCHDCGGKNCPHGTCMNKNK